MKSEKLKPSPLVNCTFSASSGSCEKIRVILLILSNKKNLKKAKATRQDLQDQQDTSAFPEERQKAQPFSEGQIVVFSQLLQETVPN